MRRVNSWKVAIALLLAIATSLTTMQVTNLFAYQNGTSIENQWATATVEYGIGDPFVMKYNGMYYLYVSSLDGQQGIKVWSSQNMVDWKYKGFCNENDSVITGAYAPEVTYWNGTFYMYTAAPGGEQHRVLTSTSPTGPFVRQGDVLSDPNDLIDGSVYIDDDAGATKYFLHAGGSCIEYSILNQNMLIGSGKYTIPAATIAGLWTEGPSIFKRNGKYYMTYTGNHVLADNYRIEYAVGDSISSFQEPTENLLLINTEEGITGLGHNSIVVGPDLDTRYIVYHSLVSNTSAPERRLNIDRIVFNGEKMEVQGPTWWEVEDPKLPEFSDYMKNTTNWTAVSGSAKASGGTMELGATAEVRSKQKTTADYTAEFNLWLSSTSSGAKAGAIVSFTDSNNYAYVYIDPQSNKVFFQTKVKGTTATSSASLPSEYAGKNNVLRKITVKKEGNTFDIYVDDRLLITASATLSGGYIGLKTENCSTKFGYTAFSSTVNGNQDKDTVKPTGSAMDAVHANSASWTYQTGTLTESGAGLKSEYVKGMSKGNSLTFKIDAQETSYYSAEIRAKAQAGTTVSIAVDGKVVAKDVSLTKSDGFMTDVIRNVKIAESANTVTITVTAGSMDFYSLKLAKGADIYETKQTQSAMDFEWLSGSWSDNGTTISATNSATWSIASYGNENWGDYEVEADVNLKNGSDAGLLVRLKYATDASDATYGIGGCQNGDYHYGYYAYITTSGVCLGKQMFHWQFLTSSTQSLSNNKTYRLKVRAEGANIKVWLDGKLMIDYTDKEQPLLSGKIGMRAHMSLAEYKNMTLTHLNTATPVNAQVTLTAGATAINKNNFQLYSSADGKGYEMKDGGIDFNNGLNRNVKGVLKNSVGVDGTVSCTLDLPGTGGFGVGLLVRCKRSYFGNGIDDLDGLGVQLERGGNGSVNVKVYEWSNKAWKGVVAETNIKNYFVNQADKRAYLAVQLKGNAMTVYVDGTKYLTVDISKWSGDSSRTAIGFRSQNSAHVMLSNFTYSTQTNSVPTVPPTVKPTATPNVTTATPNGTTPGATAAGATTAGATVAGATVDVPTETQAGTTGQASTATVGSTAEGATSATPTAGSGGTVEEPQDSGWVLYVVIGVIILAAIGGVVVLVVLRKRGEKT